MQFIRRTIKTTLKNWDGNRDKQGKHVVNITVRFEYYFVFVNTLDNEQN